MLFVACMLVGVPGFFAAMPAQSDVSDADLQEASPGRTVRVGGGAGGGRVTTVPLEVYVARVLAGEGEPGAPDAALQALAVAIRTFAIFNAGRHGKDGFDLCDSTHCQVPRAATATTRRAAMATAGRILTYNGAPAEIFYSASCGGRSESAAQVWPRSNLPYLRSVADDVHDDDEPWTLEVPLRDVQRTLARAGFDGSRLTNVTVDARSASGRVARLTLDGLRPAVITGEAFRAAMGPREFRSTAFSVKREGRSLHFTGQGYGHGVGMCVIGAGRRARRGEDVEGILGKYYPGLALTRLSATGARVSRPAVVPPAPPAPSGPSAKASASTPLAIVRVERGSGASASEIERFAARAHQRLSQALGTSVSPVTITVHESLDTFRNVTGKPWWVSAVAEGTAIDLAPVALLAQRDGVEATVAVAVAELLMEPTLAGRPAWVLTGASRYFARLPAVAAAVRSRVRCPSDAELTLAVSAAAQREADARAEACFARAFAQTRDWRTVR